MRRVSQGYGRLARSLSRTVIFLLHRVPRTPHTTPETRIRPEAIVLFNDIYFVCLFLMCKECSFCVERFDYCLVLCLFVFAHMLIGCKLYL